MRPPIVGRSRLAAVFVVTSIILSIVGLPSADADHEPGHPPQWNLLGNTGTTPGIHFLGTTDNNRLEIKVNNSRALRIEPGDPPNLIGGHPDNAVTGGVVGGTISGGGQAIPANNAVNASLGSIGGGRRNRAGDDASVAGGFNNGATAKESAVSGGLSNTASGSNAGVGGGWMNVAGGPDSTVRGGVSNAASGDAATIAGGDAGIASAPGATVGGGFFNTASGISATVPGGSRNTAAGFDSFAAGTRAVAGHNGSFVWADNNFSFDFHSAAADELSARVRGGVRLVPAIDGAGTASASMSLMGFGPDTGLLRVENAKPTTAGRTVFELINNGSPRFFFTDTSFGGVDWQFSKLSNHNFTVSDLADGGPELILQPNGLLRVGDAGTSKLVLDAFGNLTIAGTLTESSDRRMKTQIAPVDAADVRSSLRRLSITQWRYRDDPQKLVHVGPMAQDVHRLFGVGTPTTIVSRDIASLALIALMGLDRDIGDIRRSAAEIQATR